MSSRRLPGNPNAQNELPETHSGNIWRQAAKMLKMKLLRLILAISGWPYLAPGSQNAQNGGAFASKSQNPAS